MINSTANSQIKNIIALQTKSKVRNNRNCFIIEGTRMFMEIPDRRIIKTYVTGTFYEDISDEVRHKLESAPYELVSDEVFKRISDTVTPQGILAIVEKNELKLENLSDGRLYMILEDIQDPGNLGTIIRTSEAAGVSGVIMNKGTVDIYNPKVVRSTMGAIFRVPFVYADELDDAIEILKSKNVKIYAAHLKGKEYYYEKNYTQPCAFLIGNEGNGLSDRISKKADELIKIPMYGNVESLNAACAATVLMYETVRQNSYYYSDK